MTYLRDVGWILSCRSCRVNLVRWLQLYLRTYPANPRSGRGWMLLKIIARIECMQFILAANINYVTCKLFSVAHVRDPRSLAKETAIMTVETKRRFLASLRWIGRIHLDDKIENGNGGEVSPRHKSRSSNYSFFSSFGSSFLASFLGPLPIAIKDALACILARG